MHANSVPGPENPETLGGRHITGHSYQVLQSSGPWWQRRERNNGKSQCKIIESGEVWVKLKTRDPPKTFKPNFSFFFFSSEHLPEAAHKL